ncbi:histidine phosphatase superfamily [Pelagophyceae sp. CCMP2097]|nr:histidine phosphatase superfamily [Pelagophyceae sp. CCMP2097]
MKFGDDAHCRVCFVRHGQSQWNEANLFTGWADPALTTLGKNEAAEGATHMWKEGLHFDVAFTSELKRAQQTLAIIQTILGEEAVPVHKSWRLNERMYGALQGLDKKETVEKYGADQVKEWRRSYSTPPPPVDVDSEYWPGNMNSYAHVPAADIPLSECLKDTVERTLPYWDAAVVPALTRGKTVLIAAHGNSIRGMLKMLDGIEDDDIVGLEIPTGVPLLYHLDKDLKPMKDPRSFGFLSGAFLGDPAEILAAQQKVAAQTQISSKETETEARARLFAEAQGQRV